MQLEGAGNTMGNCGEYGKKNTLTKEEEETDVGEDKEEIKEEEME